MIERGGSLLGGAMGVLGLAGRIILLPILGAVAVTVGSSIDFFRAFAVPSAGSAAAVQPRDRSAEMDQRIAQFGGRSLFFRPAPPPAPPPPIADRPPPVEDRPPPPPTRYAGPAIIAMINESVWFADGRRLSVGAEAERGLRVVHVEPPWRATVEWSGQEFTVNFFDQDKVVLPTPAPETPATAATENEGQS